MEKSLPLYASRTRKKLPAGTRILLALCSVATLIFFIVSPSATVDRNVSKIPRHAAEIQARCRALNTKPGPPSDFYDRAVSDRFVKGTKPVLITNATIWTGRVQGLEVLHGDIYIDGGIIKGLGRLDQATVDKAVETIDARGAFITPGRVLVEQLLLFSVLNSHTLVSSTSTRIWELSLPLPLVVQQTEIRTRAPFSLGSALSMG